MRETIWSLSARIETDARRQAEVSHHIRRVEASLREVHDRLYLLRARHLCLDARLATLSERLAAIEDEVGRQRALRATPPSPVDQPARDPARAEGCPRAA